MWSTRCRPLLIPGKELLEQRLFRRVRQIAGHPRAGLRQEGVEPRLRGGAGCASRGLPDQPVLRGLEPGPARYFRCQVHFAPLWMARRLLELVELAEEGIHEAVDLVVPRSE